MQFCPTCGNLLQYEAPDVGHKGRFFCPTCPYVCELENKIKTRQRVTRKKIEPIFSDQEALRTAAQTEASCPHCNWGKAYFMQIQIRSADEPSTTFYKCCREECGREWRED